MAALQLVPIEQRLASSVVADRLEALAARIRSGELPTKAIWYLHIAPDDMWQEFLIGDCWISQLLGMIDRARFALLLGQHKKDCGNNG